MRGVARDWRPTGALATLQEVSVELSKPIIELQRVGAEQSFDGRLVVCASEAMTEPHEAITVLSQELASLLEPAVVVEHLARRSTEVLSDGCMVYLRDEDGAIRRSATADRNATRDRLLRQLRGTAVEASSAHPAAEVLRTGATLLLETGDAGIEHFLDAGSGNPTSYAALHVHSAIVVPLRARGEVYGAVGFFASEPDRAGFTRGDLRVVEQLAHSAGLALDNARLCREARQATRTREEVMSVVAHDLRSPLAAIAVSAELIDLGVSVDLRRYHVEVIQRSVAFISRLIQDLADAATLEAGQLSMDPRIQSLSPLVSEAVEFARPHALAKEVTLIHEQAAGDPKAVVDRFRLLQVLANLIDNAVKFTPPGGEVRLSVAEVERGVEICVRDTGPGIPAESQPKVYDRFWRGGPDVSRGIGLGLSIAKGIVQALGGEIRLESEVGNGASFFVLLPPASRGPAVADAVPTIAVPGWLGA
jgi:signal transduction histidine kinase